MTVRTNGCDAFGMIRWRSCLGRSGDLRRLVELELSVCSTVSDRESMSSAKTMGRDFLGTDRAVGRDRMRRRGVDDDVHSAAQPLFAG